MNSDDFIWVLKCNYLVLFRLPLYVSDLNIVMTNAQQRYKFPRCTWRHWLLQTERAKKVNADNLTWISSHLISFSTSLWLSSINSSCCTTSAKCFCENSSAACIKSRQLCVSAKSRIPRQFDGSNWLLRKSQQALFTPAENKHTNNVRLPYLH